MNRRSFLRFAAVAPVMGPVIAPAFAAGRGMAFGIALKPLSFGTVSWLGDFERHTWRSTFAEPTLSESVNASVNQMVGIADRAASFGTRAEGAVYKLTNLAIKCVEQVTPPPAPAADPIVASQMTDDDLFEADIRSAA